MALKYLYVPSGYKAGTAYGVLPNDSSSDFDNFSRPSFATRTNKDGLLETYQTFGNNLVTNGGFAADTNWVKSSSSVTISGGKANFTNTSNGNTLRQDNFLTSGKRYEVSFTVSNYTEGSVKVGRPFITPSVNSNGVYTVTGIATSVGTGGSDDLQFQVTGTTTLSIDDVSVKEVAINVPRIDYSDGGCPSLLLEPQRTNIAEYSENTLSWGLNDSNNWGGTRTANVVVSPDGRKSADLISVIQPSGVYVPFMNVTAGTTYSSSVYAKHISGTSTLKFALTSNFYGGTSTSEKGIFVDLSDGSIISNTIGEFANAKVIDVGNGWYRLCLEGHVARATGTATVTCYAQNTSFSEYSIWGGQVEIGSFASSYIPNLSNSQTTRNGDKGNLAGNFDALDNDSGVLEARFKAFTTDYSSRRITLGATDSNRVVLGYGYNNGTVKPYLLIVGSGIDDIYISMPSSFNIFDYNTYQLKFESGNNELKINGELVDTDTSFNTLNFTFSASLTNISLNYYNDSSNRIFQGGLKHIKVYDSITDF